MVTNEWIYVFNDLGCEVVIEKYKRTLERFFGIKTDYKRIRLQTIGFINLLKLSMLYPELSFMVSYELNHYNVYEYVYIQNGKIISTLDKDTLHNGLIADPMNE